MNFEETIALHAKIYKKLSPRDAVKLAYQSVFGPEHMISDANAAANRLFDEYSKTGHDRPFRTENLGRFSRVYLDSPLTDAELSLVGKIFINSAASPKGDTAEFSEKLDIIARLAGNGELPFGYGEFAAFRAEYEKDDPKAVSHSDEYRNEYHPAYRLVDSKYVRLLPLIFAVSKRESAVLALDGRAASGKTTAAKLIAELFGGKVVHLDDFFLPFEKRTPERLAEPGGNLDRERFLEEVVPNVRGEFSYRVFDCQSGGFRENPRKIGKSKLLICEGAYSLHPAFGKYYDISAFSAIAPEEQQKRILARNGERMWQNFRERWIPMEEKYFETFNIAEKCDFII